MSRHRVVYSFLLRGGIGTDPEVAEILECSVEMVKWNVFQARKKLKEELGRYLEE